MDIHWPMKVPKTERNLRNILRHEVKFLFMRGMPVLVGGLEHCLFFHILGIIIPTDELIFFRGVGSTTNQSNI